MEVQAVSKFVKMSPSKARDLARRLKGMLANAENNADLSADDLHVKQAVIDEGPRAKRFWPRARGMVSKIERKMCHVKIVLTDGK